MRKSYIFSFIRILPIFVALFFISSCQKQEVPQDVATLGVGSYVSLQKSNNQFIDALDLSKKLSVQLKAVGSEQSKLVLYVTVGGRATLNRANWKKLKEIPNSSNGDYLVEISGTEVANLLGLTPAPGDQYTIYSQVITKDGRTFDIANTAPDLAGQPGYSGALTWVATVGCPFVVSDAVGTWVITEDEWDGAEGETVEVSATNNSATLTYAFPLADPPGINPIILTVDPASGAVTVKRQLYGSYGTSTNWSADGTGFFFSCTKKIILRLNHSRNGTVNFTGSLRLSKP